MIFHYERAPGDGVMSAREEVLLWGLIDWVGFERVHWYVARENAGEPLSVIQCRTLDLIRSLVSDGLFELGELDDDCRFVAWSTPLDESIQRIREVYQPEYDNQDAWWFVCWLSPTEKGLQVAEAIEASADAAGGS